ncbi:hypothetical protein BJV38_002157 [Clostridium beijerinckii]|nr:hypothetical protein [Clostridium beijerinckii]NRT45314.1 hypothetical protein [Clostridium beijerinckii]NRZ20689.1 hypothetical protein [Clostridium beijerinckii]
MSIGDKKTNYSKEGHITFTVDEIIAPFKATAIHVGAISLPYFSIFGSSFNNASNEEIEQSAQDYVNYILNDNNN